MTGHPALTNDALFALMKTRGTPAQPWFERLPSILSKCENLWSLTIEAPFPNISYNYVAGATRADGTPVVLKISPPDDVEFQTEVEALRLFGGRGAAYLLEADPELGAVLVERLQPGTPLEALLDDEEATYIAADVMQNLWQPAPVNHNFPTTMDWASGFKRMRRRFDGGTGPLPSRLVDHAERLFAELHTSPTEPVLLHGDLHHGNILSSSRAPWLAIDPKGLIGEPAYEVGALLRNPLPRLLTLPDPARVLNRRLDILSECLALDRQRLCAWGFAQAVLSAWWCVEDESDGLEPAIRCAELLEPLLVHNR